jgi:hypothetical protein
MNVLFVAAEAAPLMKVGGLADVAGALPNQLVRDGVDAALVMPLYKKNRHLITTSLPVTATFLALGERQEECRVYMLPDADGTKRYLLDIPAAFERDAVYGEFDDDARFILFARGVMHLIQHLREVNAWNVDVVHANDWHTALVLAYMRTRYNYTFGHIATVFTIHNLAYQGEYGGWSRHLAGLDEWGGVEHNAGLPGDTFNFMARGLLAADMINTVSPTYANEIMSPAYGERLDGVIRRMKVKTAAGVFDLGPKVFHDDAVAQGFRQKLVKFGVYLIDSFKLIDGRTYAVINNYPGAQNALAVLNDSRDTLEILGHYNEPAALRLTESSVNRLPDGTWLAICRAESGDRNYVFSTSKDGRTWTQGEPRAFVAKGSNSKPTFDKFNGVYYLGWQEASRMQDGRGVGRKIFNIEISRDGVTWERKFRFETEDSFQYPTFRQHAGAVWFSVTQGTRDSSDRIMFGRLETLSARE